MITTQYKEIVSNLLAGNSNYTPNYVYLEFENTSSEVSTPSDETSGKSYYDDLGSTKGYLRIPIVITPAVKNDRIMYTVLVTSTESETDLPFVTDDSPSSRIYGIALVSAPDPADSTKDVVFSREYLTGNKQLTATENQTLCVSFQVAITDQPGEDLSWVDYD